MIDEYLQNWLIKAEHDLKAAENELKAAAEDMLTDVICFHCQQAAEKFLKACLIARKIEFGKTHNLKLLLEMCANQDKEFSGIDLGKLSFYAVQVRYPDDFYMPTPQEAREAFGVAVAIKRFVLGKLK